MSLTERFRRAREQGRKQKQDIASQDEQVKNARYDSVVQEVAETIKKLKAFETEKVMPILIAARDSLDVEDAKIQSSMLYVKPDTQAGLLSQNPLGGLPETYPSDGWWGWRSLEGTDRNLIRLSELRWDEVSWQESGGWDDDFINTNGAYQAIKIKIFEKGQSMIQLPGDNSVRLPSTDSERWKEEVVQKVEGILKSGHTHFEY